MSDKVIAKGMKYLLRQQLPSGGFSSRTAISHADFKVAQIKYTTFFPSLILSALNACNNQDALTVKEYIARFLMAQKSTDWSFNYWDRTSKMAQTSPYPDDLDDSFCAATALYGHDHNILGGDDLAALARLLINNEASEGGPYKTWLVDETADKAWQDIDPAVNCNIAGFLAGQGIELPNITAYIEKLIRKDELRSPYYADDYPLLYFASRWYQRSLKRKLVNTLLKRQTDGHWGNPMHTALAVTSLLNLGYHADKLNTAVEYLKTSQQVNGSWPAQAFCAEQIKGETYYYAGSRSLTTALCIEALGLHTKNLMAEEIALDATAVTNPAYELVKQKVAQTIAELDHPDLERHTTTVLERILHQDGDGQIILLPWFIAKAANLSVDREILVSLSAGSLWGWMAYTTYDDFLDSEGQPQLLPSANVCLRHLIRLQARTLPDNLAFQLEVHKIMNRLDAANSWEMSHCRGLIAGQKLCIAELPDYGDLWQLADRSLGHTIAGLGVLYAAGLAANDASLEALRLFFKHYLIARQLNDDAHDWEEDLRTGHINSVAVLILENWLSSGHDLHEGIDLAHTEELRRIMWERAICDTCDLINYHVLQARQALKLAGGQFDGKMLGAILKPIEAAAQLALKKRDEALDFIAAF